MTNRSIHFLLPSVMAMSLLFGLHLSAQEGKRPDHAVAASSKYGTLNVKDFGAKGDGIADDTDAIQRCLLKAASPDYPKFFYHAYAATPEVFFPKGTYRVSRTLLAPPCGGSSGYGLINLRGEDATIRQDHPTEDIFYFQLAYRNLIEGLTFEGGKRQIKLWSRNLDQGHIIIRDCVFKNSSGYAIDDQLRKRKKTGNPYENLSDMVEPFVISANERGLPVLTPVDESSLPSYPFVSTCMHITRCSFVRCMNVLSGWADWLVMEDCTLETHPEMDGPAILSGGQLMLENVTGLGHVTPGKFPCWIEKVSDGQEDGITLKNVKLKTDSKNGWCAIRNQYKYSGGRHVALIADNCEFQSAGSRENCLIELMEIPNLIHVRNCRETSGRDVPVLGFGKSFEEDDLHYQSPEVFSFLIDDNNSHLIPNLSAEMRPFADRPLPEEIARRFERKPSSLTPPRMREGLAHTVNLMDYGVKGDGTVDEAPAFQRALDAARKLSSLVEVLVPNGLYRLDKTVELPPWVVMRATGHAALTVPAGRKGPIFNIFGAEHVLLQNFQFFKCKQAVAIATRTNQVSDILIDNCVFEEIGDFAVTCLSGGGEIAEPNQTTLRISDCTFGYSRVLLQNARRAFFDVNWITTDPDMINSGAIVNKGALDLFGFCGVPNTDRENKTSGKNTADTRANDMRWIDNYDQVACHECRFGGEGGGLPMVVNFARKGSVLIENSWCDDYRGNPRRVTIVDCEEIPELIALRGNLGWPWPQRMVTIRAGAHGDLKGRLFESANTAPPWIKDERETKK